ncbi:hypothetical protein ACLOJK_030445 [Asimina triloba]
MALQLSFSFLFLVLLPAFSSADDPFICSRATYYGSPDCWGTPSNVSLNKVGAFDEKLQVLMPSSFAGACGFGEFGKYMNGGEVGAAANLYKGGSGCGACYQVRCTDPRLCNEDGVKIVVTDHGQGDNTDFILSPRGYGKLARPNMGAELKARGVVDIEFRRIPCQYPGYNLIVKAHESSRFPEYLAIVFLYQAGKKDITAVELCQEDGKEWRAMRRAYGGVWDMSNPANGPLDLRFRVSGEDGEKWIQLRSVIPSEWKAGAAYDTAMQLF